MWEMWMGAGGGEGVCGVCVAERDDAYENER